MNDDITTIESENDDNLHSCREIMVFPKDSDEQNSDLPTDLTPEDTSNNPLELELNPIQQFFKTVSPILREGGLPVAVILALGCIAVPLAMLKSSLIASILASGAVAVGVISVLSVIIIYRRNSSN